MTGRILDNTEQYADRKSILHDIPAEKIYIACGRTDMRLSLDGLAAIVQQSFKHKPFERNLYLFCGRRSDRIKALYYDADGYILLYKRMERGAYKWPRRESEVRQISWRQLRWLLEGLSIEQPKAFTAVAPKYII
jgi:transposase